MLNYKKNTLFKTAGLCAIFTINALFASGAQAQSINYQVYQNPENVTYQIVLSQMQDLYKDNNWYWDQDMQKWVTYPAIGVAETDLSGDRIPEIIAYPTEDMEEYGLYCTESGACPHHIMEVRDNEIVSLGIITTHTLAPDQEYKNGYRRLRVYNKDPEIDPYYFVFYDYDPERESYAPSP